MLHPLFNTISHSRLLQDEADVVCLQQPDTHLIVLPRAVDPVLTDYVNRLDIEALAFGGSPHLKHYRMIVS